VEHEARMPGARRRPWDACARGCLCEP
jgi:hypothetical protein